MTEFPQRVGRARLYEQVAAKITDWIAQQELHAGDRLPPERELVTEELRAAPAPGRSATRSRHTPTGSPR